MILQGKIHLDDEGEYKMVEIPMLDLASQGKDAQECFAMIEDAVKLLCPALKFKLVWVDQASGDFLLDSRDPLVLGLILKRQREAAGLSLREAAYRLGYKSHNAVSAYENGQREPTVSKFEELLAQYGHTLKAA